MYEGKPIKRTGNIELLSFFTAEIMPSKSGVYAPFLYFRIYFRVIAGANSVAPYAVFVTAVWLLRCGL